MKIALGGAVASSSPSSSPSDCQPHMESGKRRRRDGGERRRGEGRGEANGVPWWRSREEERGRVRKRVSGEA